MTNSNLISISQKLYVLSEQKNKFKQFEFIIKDGKLINIKIFTSSGQLLNETCLNDGKIISYKIYKSKIYEADDTGFGSTDVFTQTLNGNDSSTGFFTSNTVPLQGNTFDGSN